ncbi:protein phosphatase 2C domain-containing protein [Gordonia jinhuaensis]|uniref:Serine/threonine protein phosphatase n=1 Tax=Gordonia jinhuaensis TaxID=1517702 RepID=A0A916WZ19_9ACTN|nr:protein phosphatase 2C domain-containing protein [Gordonia jinhuaensis]GGB43521.1 serine/threonine protein phosphatase [Gordonia jinhuaensis]
MTTQSTPGMVRDESDSGVNVSGPAEIAWAAASDVGRHRVSNEDAALVASRLYAVADGMGGHDCGEIASEAAVAALERIEPGELTDTRDALVAAFFDAQDRIEHIRSGSGRRAGTTVTGAALVHHEGQAYWLAFNIGDSRTYRLSGGVLEQVTVDHSQVQELVDAGFLTPDQARVDPRRNVITRALGAGMLVEPDFFAFPAVVGETVLICSDGLTGELPDAEIAEIIEEAAGVGAAAQALIEAARNMGGHDNITAVLARPLVVGTHAVDRSADEGTDTTLRVNGVAAGGGAHEGGTTDGGAREASASDPADRRP